MTFLEEIARKIDREERLSFDDGVRLMKEHDVGAVGQLANRVRQRRHGDKAYFNVNTHLNATNVCIADCHFCSFARLQEGMPGAYTMTVDEALAKLRARPADLTEIHIVNGLHPGLPFSYYEDLLRGIKRERPHLHIKAFTAVEIQFFVEKFGFTVEECLQKLIDAGLGSLPGGGAEVFSERVRRKICADKVDADGWLAIHKTAHRLGLRSNCTLLYGHIETVEERVDHMLRLRALQDETGGFQTFIPLAFHNENNALEKLPGPTGLDDLRLFATARLVLDNIPHVKAYWAMLGVKTAQIALWYGADDLDGTVEEEKIYKMAGSRAPDALTRGELVRLIRNAGRIPVERDTLYNVLAEGAALDAILSAKQKKSLEVLA
jgi:aminodeoxyfutalosine synthase